MHLSSKKLNPLQWFYAYVLLPVLLITVGSGGSIAMRNCLLSRKLCAGDPACRSILEIIPRVCGPETVTCSTVTANKCLAALRTVRGFPYFSPVCLCREPHLDRDCNAFREYIFDHPCEFISKDGEESPYSVHALPTCDYAARACEQLPACSNTYDRFRRACRVRDGHCRMEDSESCLWAWTQLKQLPMFGCICPNDRQKHRCDKIFTIIHHNPCVDAYLASSALPRTRPGVLSPWDLVKPPPAPPRPTPYHPAHHYPFPSPRSPWGSHRHHQHVPYLTALPPRIHSAQTHNVLSVPYPSSRSVDNSPGSFPVSVIPFDNPSLHAVDTQIQNPLVEGRPGTSSSAQNASRASDVLGGSGVRRPSDHYARMTTSSTAKKPSLHSTCQTALEGCMADRGCRRLLDPIMSTCNNKCSRDMCMDNLQTFYRNVESKWAMEIALCLCIKTNQTSDACLVAQEKLHPSCARRPAGAAPLLCSSLARSCKDDSSCRHRLEFYDQACAVDSDTRRCAGSTAECRRALLGILGTRLRNLCTCAASDPRETYTCLDWQRLLWFNPCVVESQTDYHRELLDSLGPGEDATTSPSIIIRITTEDGALVPVPLNGPTHGARGEKYRGEHDRITPAPRTPERKSPGSPTVPTTTTTTLPPNYCSKELRDGKKSDLIVEGGGRRYYKVADSCSELCQCFDGKNLVCNVLSCIPSTPCSTDYAVYSHAAPAYQAHRGACVCYSQSFICVRPKFDEYFMEQGVYLMIGFSKKEEDLMHPFTRLSVADTIPRLQKLYVQTAAEINGTNCILELHSQIDENLIVKATLQELDEFRDNMTGPLLNQEKRECEPALQEISKMINKRDPAVNQDVVLSMFLVSEVQSKVPPEPAAGERPSLASLSLLLSLILSLRVFPPS